jgi:flagellar biosynthesis protein FlhA
MADLSAQAPALRRLGAVLRQGDVALALGVVFILVVLVMPLPAWLLDILLTLSLTLSVLILLVSLFISRPLEFSSFPAVLLVATMLRLSLNLASTRLILAHGHEGTDAAGRVIESFGHFVMQGNFVIGIVVFVILVIVNFIVITKGAGRIAEVSARFSLDAMPGKQMAIDADLSAGLIDESEARARRKNLEQESAFFGAMDGAAKFVRGDAIAGVLITLVNILGGIVIGVVQSGLTLADAAHTYSLLTVGDGLVTQVPALIVSTAAGLLVSKAGVDGPANQAMFGQLGGYPKAFGLTAGLLALLALLPGVPILPFMTIAAVAGGAAWITTRNRARAAARTAEVEATPTPPAEEPIASALHIDQIRLELGYSLLVLLDSQKGHRLTEQIKALRRQIAGELGFVMPSVRIQDNMQLPGNTYVIRIKEVEAGRGELRPGSFLVMDPRGEPVTLPGEDTQEPTFGLPAKWVAAQHREEASFRGLTVVEPSTVITTHLTELVKDHMADLVSFSETQRLLDDLGKEHAKLVADLVPNRVSVGTIQRVLQALLAERVSIRDLATILEGIAEAVGFTQNITLIAEHVRARLARQLCDAVTDGSGVVPIVTLSPEWEQSFAEAVVGKGEERQLAMAPSKLQQFITQVRQTFERQAMLGHSPVLLTSPAIRPFVRSIVERFRPLTVVMSQNEIHARAKVRTLATV